MLPDHPPCAVVWEQDYTVTTPIYMYISTDTTSRVWPLDAEKLPWQPSDCIWYSTPGHGFKDKNNQIRRDEEVRKMTENVSAIA